jgi:hypothetical protein
MHGSQSVAATPAATGTLAQTPALLGTLTDVVDAPPELAALHLTWTLVAVAEQQAVTAEHAASKAGRRVPARRPRRCQPSRHRRPGHRQAGGGAHHPLITW